MSACPSCRTRRRARFEAEYGLSLPTSHASWSRRARAPTPTRPRSLAGDDDAERAGRAQWCRARWFIGDVAALLNELPGDAELADTKLTPRATSPSSCGLTEAGTITAATAKEVLAAAFESGETPGAIVEERGLGQVRDDAEIARIAAAVVEANPKPVADYRGGKDTAIKFLVGQVMRATRGRADCPPSASSPRTSCATRAARCASPSTKRAPPSAFARSSRPCGPTRRAAFAALGLAGRAALHPHARDALRGAGL